MKKFILVVSIFLRFSFSCQSAEPAVRETGPAAHETESAAEEIIQNFPPPGEPLKVSAFREIWGYVITGREEALRADLPVSDVGYCFADVNTYGTLIDVPDRRNLPPFPGRVHLVAKCDGRALSHFILKPGSAERKTLIADLIAASKSYDGLQIDFENIPARDGVTYLSFLAELRAGLEKNKMLTVALSARTRKIPDDVYDYEKVLPFVDRILVMAYDLHWSGSAPGPVASLEWCKSVAVYSLNVIGKEKLVMGMPFYGRAWVDENHARAYTYDGIERIIKENNVSDIRRENGIPTFTYNADVSVKAYYEDEHSLSTRMDMYNSMGVDAIGFWRIGQETPKVWELLKLEK